MASAPSLAVSTGKPARSTIFATSARIAGSSSTTNTRLSTPTPPGQAIKVPLSSDRKYAFTWVCAGRKSLACLLLRRKDVNHTSMSGGGLQYRIESRELTRAQQHVSPDVRRTETQIEASNADDAISRYLLGVEAEL